MKYFILILISYYLLSCEEIPKGTIAPESINYSIVDILADDIVVYSESDNSVSTSIIIENTESVENVWFDITSYNGQEDISKNNFMFTNDYSTKKTYEGQTVLDNNLLSGNYQIVYYVQDNIRSAGENIKKVGTKKFEYYTEVQNFPPFISNLVIPDSIARQTNFVFSIRVSDPNGLPDVALVYFELRRPDGTIVFSDPQNSISQFPMFDNGDEEGSGDRTSDDGIYSLKNSFGSSSQIGNWVFTFHAVDQSDAISNTIIHSLNVR